MMVTNKATVKTAKSATAKSVVSKLQGKSTLALDRKNGLIGDLPTLLDLREITLKHKGAIRIADSDTVEVIHLPDCEFSYVVIADLPNLKEIYAHGRGPTWMDCQNLPNLRTLVIDAGTRWLNVSQSGNLSEIDVGKCEQLGYLSVQQTPKLVRVKIEQCRLLPSIQGMSVADQDRLGLTMQMAVVQGSSRRDSFFYPKMTCTDIELVLANIRRGAELLKTLFPKGDEEGPDDSIASRSYGYRLLQPGEKVYTGGTGESYCYAFEVTTQETKGKKLVTHVLEERGIHEPEDAIGETLRRLASELGLTRDIAPTEDQLLTYLNLLLSGPESDPVSWTKTEDMALRLALAANPLMPAAALEQLANDRDPSIRLRVAENPASGFQVRQGLLHGLVNEIDPDTRLCIARSEAAAPEDLETLSKDSDVETLCAIAKNPMSPRALRLAVLETLSTCGESKGLLLVASSTDAPEHLLSNVLKRTDQDVLIAVSENLGAPELLRSAALEQLARFEDPKVKRSVAKNALTPPEVLDLLAKDDDWGVRYGVADNPTTPSTTLLVLSKDVDELGGEYIRKAVAGNPATPEAAFKYLVKDKDWHTRAAIAKNKSAPKVILEILAKDKEYSVRESVARNHGAPATALELLSADKKDNIKMYVASNPNTAADTLTRLASDPYYVTRREVASNRTTPITVLQLLAKDAEQQVRVAAEKSLDLLQPTK